MPDLVEIRDGWDRAARDDAMFHILTDPEKTDGRWTPDDFFAHGQAEIDRLMERVGPMVKKGRALDFGCGVGRLTQALAAHFDRVDGCDVSPEMVDRATALNRQGQKVVYRVNGLTLPFEDATFDFVYSMIVLQHMPSELAAGYVFEFVRVLKVGAVCVFQLPEGPDFTHSFPWLSMWAASKETVHRWLTKAGAELVRADRSYASGDGHEGWEYTARKLEATR